MSVIAAVEEAMLVATDTALGGTVRRKESLGGAWTLDALRRALQSAPGVYVAFLGGRAGAGAGYVDGRFACYVATKGALEPARRQGTAREIGAYEILTRLYAQLDGLPVQDVGTLRALEIGNLFGDATFDLGGAVYGITLALPNMPMTLEADLATLDDFVAFDAVHDLVQPTGSGEPEANDHLTGLDQL